MSVPRFWREFPHRYTLQASHCKNCEEVHFPPRTICPACRRESIDRMERIRLAGHGRVLEWTRVHRAAPGYGLQVPYLIALIETDEGPRVLGQVVETDHVDVGTPVQAVFRRIGEDGPSGVIHYGMKWKPVARGPREGDAEE